MERSNEIINNPNLENPNNELNSQQQTQEQEQKPKKTFFKTHQEWGSPFFKNTRVGSCSHVLVKNGRSLAIPFRIVNRRGRGLNHFKTVPEKLSVNESTYEHDYHPFPNMHCGMGKKPLMPYSPDSMRNLLPQNGIVSGALNNRSYLELGNSNLINRKQWSSTYRDSYRFPIQVPISNAGILSDLAVASHMKLNS